MRTSKSRVFLVFCFICLSCHVQQCNLLALGLMSTLTSSAASSAMTMSGAIGMSLIQSMLQAVASTLHLGITTVQTMALSLISGFIMGVLALSGFIFFLLTIIPAEEYRSLGYASATRIPIQSRFHLLNQIPHYALNATSEPIFLRNIIVKENKTVTTSEGRRQKRSTSLVRNAAAISNYKPASNNTLPYSLESIAKITNASDERIPRFLTRLVQRDPLNCLPLIMCGLNAARKPNERTEAVNDYAYLLREFLLDDVIDKDDKSENNEDDSSLEDDLFVAGKMKDMKKKENRFRSPIDFLKAIASAQKEQKKKDDVDKMIDQMHKEEEDEIEDIVLTELADDPNDLKFALEEMKVRGLKKTMSKMPHESRKKYVQKLMKDDSKEEDGDEGVEIMDDDDGPMVPMEYMGYNARNEYPGPNYEEYPGYDYYNPKRLTRGGYPKPPPLPPVPQYGPNVDSDEFYKRKLNTRGRGNKKGGGVKAKAKSKPNKNRILIATPMPPHYSMGRRRMKRNTIWSQNIPPRGFLQKKRGELMETDNLYDRARIASEIGSVARSNRQCRAFFQGCNGLKKPASSTTSKTTGGSSTSNRNKDTADDNNDDAGGNGTPFLNRAVNNIRRVLLGGPSPESSKAKRVTEIREVIQQLHPPSNHGGSEVKVVLNIGPSAGPNMITNPAAVMPAVVQMSGQDYMIQQPLVTPMPMQPFFSSPTPQELGLPPPFSTQLIPKKTDRYVVSKKPPTTTKRPMTVTKSTTRPATTKKVMIYRNPSSTSASKKPLPPLFSVPSKNLDELAQLLKTTATSPTTVINSDEEAGTTLMPNEENTISPVVFAESGEEQSVEEESVLPTRYPMSKEEYAENLRETFDIFNRFKEAHRNPPPPPTTAETMKQTPANLAKGNKLTAGGSTQSSQLASSSTKPDGVKGETGDNTQGDVQGQGQEEDIGAIWEGIKDTIKKLRKKKKKKKKGKGKKKRKKKPGKYESSEESSEEELIYIPPKHPPLVAIPAPHERRKIHWRSGTQFLADKFYHLIFRNKVAKPLPDENSHSDAGASPHYHSDSDADVSHEELHQKNEDQEEIHYNEPDITGPVIHNTKNRLKTETPSDHEDGENADGDVKPDKETNSDARTSGPTLLIAAPKKPNSSKSASKSNKAKSKVPKEEERKKASTTESSEDYEEDVEEEDEEADDTDPPPEGSSVNESEEYPENSKEDDDETDTPQEESEEYSQINRSSEHISSSSGSYEEDDDQNFKRDKLESKETKPKLVYNPFSVSTSKNAGNRARLGLGSSSATSQRPKAKEKSKKASSKSNLPPVKIKFSDLYGSKNSTERKTTQLLTHKRLAVAVTPANIKPRRRVLKYKNG